jgi:hypothetical protein
MTSSFWKKMSLCTSAMMLLLTMMLPSPTGAAETFDPRMVDASIDSPNGPISRRSFFRGLKDEKEDEKEEDEDEEDEEREEDEEEENCTPIDETSFNYTTFASFTYEGALNTTLPDVVALLETAYPLAYNGLVVGCSLQPGAIRTTVLASFVAHDGDVNRFLVATEVEV